MQNTRINSGEILKNNLFYIYEWNFEKKLWDIVDFYPLYSKTTDNSDVTKIELEEGYEEGTIKLDLPFTLEGQNGSPIGDYLANRDLKNEYNLLMIFDKLYSLRDIDVKYGTDNKGIINISGIYMLETFKKVLVPNNSYRTKTSNSGDVGYEGKIYFDNKSIKSIFTKIFNDSLFNKKKIPSPNNIILLEADRNNQAEGFKKNIFIDDYYEGIYTTIELQVQSLQEVISHLNTKELLYLNFEFKIIDGLINIFLKKPNIYTEELLKNYKNIEYSKKYNEDFVNNIITLSPDLKIYREVEKKRYFMPLVEEEVVINDEFSTEDDGAVTEETEELEKRDNSIVLNRVIIESIDSDIFLNVKVGDIINDKYIISKKLTYENGTLDLSLAYDTKEQNVSGDVDIDLPDFENDIISNSVWLYYNVSTINSDLSIGQKIKPFTKLGEFTNAFNLQTQKDSKTIEDFRRNLDNLDSVGGTHNPIDDFKKTGYVTGVILSSYKSTDSDYGFSSSYPNIGIVYGNNEVKSPSKANSEIMAIGTDLDFGNYIMIKFT